MLASMLAATDASGAPRKQLIEFGWDEPDTRFMREQIAQLQASPFDGCVFHADYRTANGDSGNFTWALWGRRRFTARDLDAARADLRATKFGRFRENFLRVNVTPADMSWFEDHSAVMANLELAARLASEAGLPGVMFDIEQYEGKLWNFLALTRREPRTWNELATRVRQLGAEAMRAFQRGYPGLTVFMTAGYSLPLFDTRFEPAKLAETDYGLLAPFLDGMVSAATGRALIVDGHELSYGYREPARFSAQADSMRHGVRRLAADPDRYARHRSVSFGIWMDHDWRQYGWDDRDLSRNYFTPAALASSVQAALDHADRYVWVYSEKPRWWSPEGGPRALPAAYDSVLRAARR
jgi:hypothetical protein